MKWRRERLRLAASVPLAVRATTARAAVATVSEQIRAAYECSDLTLAEIAFISGASETTVLQALRGHNVTLANAVAIAETLQMRVLELSPLRHRARDGAESESLDATVP